MIEDDRDEMAMQMQKPFQSLLLPLISSLTNCPEFKYRWDDVWTLPIGVFMDSVERVQKTQELQLCDARDLQRLRGYEKARQKGTTLDGGSEMIPK